MLVVVFVGSSHVLLLALSLPGPIWWLSILRAVEQTLDLRRSVPLLNVGFPACLALLPKAPDVYLSDVDSTEARDGSAITSIVGSPLHGRSATDQLPTYLGTQSKVSKSGFI